MSRIWRTCGRAKWVSERKHVLVPGKWSNKARALQGEWAQCVPETARKPAWPRVRDGDRENGSSSRNSHLEQNKIILPFQNTRRKVTFYSKCFK